MSGTPSLLREKAFPQKIVQLSDSLGSKRCKQFVVDFGRFGERTRPNDVAVVVIARPVVAAGLVVVRDNGFDRRCESRSPADCGASR